MKRDHEGEYQRGIVYSTVFGVYILFFRWVDDFLFTLFTLWDTVTLLISHPQSQSGSYFNKVHTTQVFPLEASPVVATHT